MWRGSIIDLLNAWYKRRLRLQGITLTSLAWWLFSSQLQSLFVPEKWSKQHETTNKLVGCLSTRFSTVPFHSLLARSGIQVWYTEADKPRSTQGMAMMRSQSAIFSILSWIDCSSVTDLSTLELDRYPYAAGKSSHVCKATGFKHLWFQAHDPMQ